MHMYKEFAHFIHCQYHKILFFIPILNIIWPAYGTVNRPIFSLLVQIFLCDSIVIVVLLPFESKPTEKREQNVWRSEKIWTGSHQTLDSNLENHSTSNNYICFITQHNCATIPIADTRPIISKPSNCFALVYQSFCSCTIEDRL